MVEIIDSNYLSIGFPIKNWNSLIERDNFIDSITSKLNDENKLVFLSGDEGIGKSTLLGQFCKRNNLNVLSVFFNPHHSLDLDINYLRTNLHDQIEHHLGKEISESDRDNFVTHEKYRLSWFNLKKKYRSSREKIYLIIDGLESREPIYDQTIIKLLKEIPYGDDYLRVVITGSSEKLKQLCPDLKQIKSEEISVVGLTNHQIENFLGKKVMSIIKSNQDLIKVTNGYPGRLEVLKRLVLDGVDIEQISSSKNFQNWIDLDTSKIDLTNPLNSLILSLLALCNNRLSISDISNISEKSIDEIREKIKQIHVIEEVDNIVQFISITYSKYFNTLLRGKQRNIDDLLIRHYASSNTLINRFELSKLYVNQKKWNKIPELINESYLEETIKDTGSIERVNQSIDLGYISSQEMKQYSEVYKFCVQGSIVNELDNYLFWESEIKARISLNDFVGAIDLAERAVLKVDRLRLLSLVARKQKEINKNVDIELVKLIKILYDSTNLAGVGNAIYDIVSNLIYAIPNLAIEIIEKTSGNATESNINDWIVAKISLAAINSEEKESNEKDIKLKALEKLNNPSVKKIQRAISLMVGNYSSKKVIEEVGKINDSNEKLKLLRLWLKNNRTHNVNLKEVILITLDELVSSSNNSESILDTLNDLSTQLNKIRNVDDKEMLLKRFKEFDSSIKQVGLSRDIYRYRLNIFEVQHSIKKDQAEHTLTKIISDIYKIEDNLIKIESYCEVFYKLSIIKDFQLTIYYNRVYGRIKNSIEELLNESANHLKITENIIKTVGRVNPRFAVEICQKVNTSYSRDSSRLKIISAYLDNSIKRINETDLNIVISSFENKIPKEIAIENILERYSNSKSLPTKVLQSILTYISEIDNMKTNSIRLNCGVLAVQIISKNSYWKNRLFEKQKRTLNSIWEEIESDWDRIDAGYNISSEISLVDSEFAKEIFEKTTIIKNQSWLDSKSVATTYINCLRLIIKAYSAILKNNNENTNDFERVKQLIDRIPSEIEKLQLWSEIAIIAIINENHNISKKVYDNHIIPLTSSLLKHKKGIEDAVECFVVIHHFNTDLASEYLDLVSDYCKEEACVRISDFYITQRSPFEYYDGEISNYKSTFDNLFKAVKILNEIQTDNLIYIQIAEITRAIKETSNLSKQQKVELRNRMEDIINIKLPDPKNITHEGYRILSKIQLELIDRTSIPWESYVDEANLIPNLSDRLFVKGVFLEEIPFTRNANLKKQLIDDVFNELTKLSSHYEYVDRVIHLSKTMYDLSRVKWQKIINKAFDISSNFEEGQEMYDYQKNILDTIYRIDEKFAKTLAEKSNKSNAEINKEYLKDYYQTLELSKKIKNNESLEDIQKNNEKMIINAIMKAQGSLNSGKIMTKKIADVAQYLKIGKSIALSESFPVFLYFLSNSANIRLTQNLKSTVVDSQRETFEYMLQSVKLVELLSQKRKLEHSINTKVFIDEDFIENLVVKPNTREGAVNYIRNWIINDVEDFLIITDPYFKKEDIEILKYVKEIDKEIETFFIGCNDGSTSNLEVDFEKHWKKISDQEPPQTKVIFCWIPENVSIKLIHDRWLISKNGGLRLGTSFGSLGANKESEISVIRPNEAFNIHEETIKNYMENKTRYLNSQKIKYKSFTL